MGRAFGGGSPSPTTGTATTPGGPPGATTAGGPTPATTAPATTPTVQPTTGDVATGADVTGTAIPDADAPAEGLDNVRSTVKTGSENEALKEAAAKKSSDVEITGDEVELTLGGRVGSYEDGESGITFKKGEPQTVSRDDAERLLREVEQHATVRFTVRNPE